MAKLKIAIIGGKAQARYWKNRDGYEVWCMNGQMRRFHFLPRIDRTFNVHLFDLLQQYRYDFSADLTWCHEHPAVPHYVGDKWPLRIRPDNQKIFPRAAIAKMGGRKHYHCGSFDWLVAFAASLGASDIALHGVGLCLEPGEPISARACLEYWCGFAEGRGIAVHIADDSDIFNFYHLVKSKLIYGYDDTPIYEDRTRRGRTRTTKAGG